MNIRKLKKLLKNNDGGTIKFKDKFRRKTYYFDLYYQNAYPILIKMKKKNDFILLLSSNEEHKLFDTIESVQEYLEYPGQLKVGSIIEMDYIFEVADRELSLELFDNIMISDQLEEHSSDEKPIIDSYLDSYSSSSKNDPLQPKKKKSYSIFTTNKPVSKPRFDWNDAYLEGLRIHGNIDDAESHADDEEYKYKKN